MEKRSFRAKTDSEKPVKKNDTAKRVPKEMSKGESKEARKESSKGEFKGTRKEAGKSELKETRRESSKGEFKGTAKKFTKGAPKGTPKTDAGKREFARNGRTGKPSFKDGKPARKASRCPYSSKCGGCQYIDMVYKQQLKVKHDRVADLLSPYCKVEDFIGMKEPDHYRCKVHAVFTHDRKGNPLSGIYQEGSHKVVPVDACLLENEKADAIIATIRSMLRSFKIKVYDEDYDQGLLRHVLIRVGHNSGQIMVVLVLTSPILPSKNNFVKALLKAHPEITTIVLNVNDKHTSMVLGDQEKTLYGKGYIMDTVCGMEFKMSPKSFYQVNPVQTEKLYAKAIELTGLSGKERVMDCYSGVGTIGIIASRAAKEVISVELNRDAVRDAIQNAKQNNVTNVTFYENDASRFMQQMADAGEHMDVVFMDPPRSGATEVFLKSMFALSPKRVAYISCSPDSLARDLGIITKNGYKVEHCIPVDMFPYTRSVETIVILQKESR